MVHLDSGSRREDGRTKAASINTARIVVTDPDDCIGRVRALGMNMRVNQLSRGRFSACFDALDLPGLHLTHSGVGPSITSLRSAPKGSYVLGFLVPGTGTLHFNHRLRQRHEISASPPDAEMHALLAPGMQAVTVLVDAAHIDRKAEALYGRPLSRLIGADHVLQSTAAAVALSVERLGLVLSEALADASSLDARLRETEGAGHALESEILDAVLGAILDPEPLRGWSARERIVRRARDVIESDLHDATTVADLCLAVGVPIRTLDAAFQSCLGVTPKLFMIVMRLNKARRYLSMPRADTTVTEAATRFGFFHFGRFSVSYHRLFGELPSETLHRARR